MGIWKKDLSWGKDKEDYLIPFIEKYFDSKCKDTFNDNRGDVLLENDIIIEIKSDTSVNGFSNNMVIEYNSRGKESGILTTHSKYYLYYYPYFLHEYKQNNLFIVKTEYLLYLYYNKNKFTDKSLIRYNVNAGDDKTSISYLLNRYRFNKFEYKTFLPYIEKGLN